jgi:Glycosyltransferase sugar-binding region containing DXD motif
MKTETLVQYVLLSLILGIMILVILYLAQILYRRKQALLSAAPSVIPLNIFQTWHTKTLPPYMQKCVNSIKECNPEFRHFLYDDEDCRQFISQNYDQDVLTAYDTLIPGAYKADLWRYCVLYKYGGIYLDIKYQCVNGFKLIGLTDREYFVRDRDQNIHGIYNAFMICKAGNPIMWKCIRQIVDNVENRYYGKTPLDVTGPNMMNLMFTPNELRQYVTLYLHNNGIMIIYNGTAILAVYPEYREEQKTFQKTLYYDTLWKRREIFV